MKITHIDCTLRDGGYYNNWNFNKSLIDKYIKSMISLNIDYVELGFRMIDQDISKGYTAYTTDNFIDSINNIHKLKIGVMVNASDLINYKYGIIKALEKLFPKPNLTKIKLVRIACHINEINEAIKSIRWLKQKKFIVGLNLMQISNYDKKMRNKISKLISKEKIDVVYLADSLGTLKEDDIKDIIIDFKTNCDQHIGIHTHDNMGRAISNTILAINSGASWVDSTVLGMGRGPGNAKTELLLLELSNHKKNFFSQVDLISLINDYFNDLHTKYNWGTNIYYYLSGLYKIHPTYIQELLNDKSHTKDEIINIINHLKDLESKKFNPENLFSAKFFFQGKTKGKWSPAKFLKSREILLIGPGLNIEKKIDEIEDYIKKKKPLVFVLNTNKVIRSNLVDVRIACHPIKLSTDISTHLKMPQPLITPFSMLPKEIRYSLKGKKILDYGLSVLNDKYVIKKNYCIIPNALTLSYALAIASAGSCKRILLAGFDGYTKNNYRFSQSNNVFLLYKKMKNSKKLISITETNFDIDYNSIYNLN